MSVYFTTPDATIIRDQLKYNTCSEAYYELVCRSFHEHHNYGIEGGCKGENGELGCTNKPPCLKILSAGAEVARTQKVYSSSATDSSNI